MLATTEEMYRRIKCLSLTVVVVVVVVLSFQKDTKLISYILKTNKNHFHKQCKDNFGQHVVVSGLKDHQSDREPVLGECSLLAVNA